MPENPDLYYIKYPRSIIFREILNTGIGCAGSFITTSKGLTA
jgi:hypothetical protein